MVLVDESLTLGEVMAREEHVTPGVPTFWVVSRGSTYAERFLSQWDHSAH